MGAPSAHAPLPPSGAEAWVRCAQWPALNALYGGKDTADTLEGTAAHAVAVRVLLGESPAVGEVAHVSADGEVIEVTDEMLEGAAILVADLPDTMDIVVGDVLTVEAIRAAPPGRVFVECRLPAVLHPDIWGTPDVWTRVTPDRIVMWDYKFGHRRVEAVGNLQCAAYLASVVHDEAEIEVRIVQPRNYDPGAPIRVWRPERADLPPIWDRLRAAAHAAMSPGRTATPGAQQCRDCPGRHACGALRDAAATLADFAGVVPHLFELSPVQAGRELAALRQAIAILAARADGIAAEVEAAYRRGERGLGWVLERGQGRRVWQASPAEVLGLGQLAGVDLAKPAEVVTPAQAKKLGVPAEIVDSMSEHRAGAEQLVPGEKSMARRAFFKE